tara:strand:+ start:339 stop:659 length:321 start_codon:yes stop_codon:yes gene_type:complete
MKEYLFIGGPADGKRFCIPNDYRAYLIPKFEPWTWRVLEKDEMKYPRIRNNAEAYHRTGFWCDDCTQIVFYLHESLCYKFQIREINIIEILMEGYRKAHEKERSYS